MGVFRSLTGTVRLELTSADMAGLLSAINGARIPVYDVQPLSYLTVRLELRRQDYPRLRDLMHRRGDSLKICARRGSYWTGKRLLKRPLLLAGLSVFLAMALTLPGRIFFVSVAGNTGLPDNLILEQAALCGIGFGAERSEVRSERMKNALLEALPQLQWAGVNTAGCVATISVKERTAEQEAERHYGVGSVVALRDGVITECTVTKGNALCKVGQAVKAGEVLVSGYTDCGITIRATCAEAEVFALTRREIAVTTPLDFTKKGENAGSKKKISLILGKKRINFYKDSGISEGSCDKMYMEYYLTLPGGFQLPAALAVEEWVYYDETVAEASGDAAVQMLSEFARSYLSEQMLSGSILSHKESLEQSENTATLYGEYTCQEMIGQVRSEEIIKSNGESD